MHILTGVAESTQRFSFSSMRFLLSQKAMIEMVMTYTMGTSS